MQTYSLMKMGLNAMDTRSKAIAQNIANINVPNYKRKYVVFEDTLKENMDNAKIEVKVDEGGTMRNDGNNVDIEYEKVNQAATSLEYNALVNLTNTKIAMTKSVITGR